MEIAEIKSKLTIIEVLNHYGLQLNGNKMLCCPFHDDKIPSIQVYPETNTVHCFSGNCLQTDKAIDPIDFIIYITI
jgi:DNA primase